jgi:hypothetical protein
VVAMDASQVDGEHGHSRTIDFAVALP